MTGIRRQRCSGCLVTFLYYRTMANKRIREKRVTKGCRGQILQFTAMMWYRYFRLTPIYLLVIGLVQVSMKWYHEHSMIELPTALDYETCQKFWWRNALYINTYFNTAERVSTFQSVGCFIKIPCVSNLLKRNGRLCHTCKYFWKNPLSEMSQILV